MLQDQDLPLLLAWEYVWQRDDDDDVVVVVIMSMPGGGVSPLLAV
jgi:hypothetical protein